MKREIIMRKFYYTFGNREPRYGGKRVALHVYEMSEDYF